MPPLSDDDKTKTARRSAAKQHQYPPEAMEFVQTGLRFAAAKVHGQAAPDQTAQHVSGRQLCNGLREYAFSRWGMMARPVLATWNIRATVDFGRIVFILVETGRLGVTDDDSLDDFRDVFDFNTFDSGYKIHSKL